MAKQVTQDFGEVMKDPQTYRNAVMNLGTIVAVGALTVPFEGLGAGFLAEEAELMSFKRAANEPLYPMGGGGTATLGETNVITETVMNGALPGSTGIPIGPKRLPNADMIEMTNKYNVEFAQIYNVGPRKNGGGGNYTLYSGNENSVSLPYGPKRMLINHTHPGSTPLPSADDVIYMKYTKLAGSPQRSSTIILANGDTPVKFNANSEYATGSTIDYLNPSGK